MICHAYEKIWLGLLPVTLVLASLLELITAIDSGIKTSGNGIGCYTCTSFNGSDPGCQDPFSPSNSHYEKACMQGMENRVGLFIAHYCIKMSGISVITGHELVVRTCALVSMANQCGMFDFEDEHYKGCLTTCERDGCNTGTRASSILSGTATTILPLLFFWLHRNGYI